MDNSTSKNVFAAVLQIDLASYLSQKGIQPVREQGHLLHYPLSSILADGRKDGELVINKLHNTWSVPQFDLQGNIIDLERLIAPCHITEAFSRLLPFAPVLEQPDFSRIISTAKNPLQIVSIKERINDERLLRFLREHQLSAIHAGRLFRQFTFLQSRIMYTGFGIVTAMGSPYVHVPHLGAYYIKPGHKFFDHQSDKINVFSSAPDLMHYMKLSERTTDPGNMLLLTDLYAFENARSIMERHRQINLYFPKGHLSEQYIGYAQWLKPSYKDFTASYGSHNSLSNARQAKLEHNRISTGKKQKP